MKTQIKPDPKRFSNETRDGEYQITLTDTTWKQLNESLDKVGLSVLIRDFSSLDRQGIICDKDKPNDKIDKSLVFYIRGLNSRVKTLHIYHSRCYSLLASMLDN